jgi:hypothetical protein
LDKNVANSFKRLSESHGWSCGKWEGLVVFLALAIASENGDNLVHISPWFEMVVMRTYVAFHPRGVDTKSDDGSCRVMAKLLPSSMGCIGNEVAGY